MQLETHPTVALAPQHVRKVICTFRKPFLSPLPPGTTRPARGRRRRRARAVAELRAPVWTEPPPPLRLKGPPASPAGALRGAVPDFQLTRPRRSRRRCAVDPRASGSRLTRRHSNEPIRRGARGLVCSSLRVGGLGEGL